MEKVTYSTQAERLLNWLNNHEYIDRPTALRNLRIANVTAVISELRKRGHAIIPVTFVSAEGVKYTKWRKGTRAVS